MKISTTLSRLPLLLAALAITPAFAANSMFGINFAKTTGNPVSGTYDGVLFSDWTAKTIVTDTTVSSHATTTFSLPQSNTANLLTGWYASGDFWNPGTTGSPSNIFGSSLGSNNNSGGTGLTGYSSIIQFSNVSAWLADNGYTSLKVTVYYSGYASTAANANLSTTGAAMIYDGVITAGNAATFTSTQTLLGTASGTMSGGVTGIYYGSGTISGLSNDFLIAAPDLAGTGSSGGGISAIKIEGMTAVPEPSTYGLIGAGALVAVAVVRRRRRSEKTA